MIRVRPSRLAAAGLLALAACMLCGCVTSEASRYQGTMSRSVQPARTANADVAGAFGLGEGSGAPVSLSAVGR